MRHVAASMSVEDVIRRRASVRAYVPGKLPWATISDILSAAVRASTAMDTQPWAFAVVQDADLLKRISDRARLLFAEEPHPELLHRGVHALDVFSKPDFNVFHDAGTLIVIGSQTQGRFVTADCWLAAGNLMLQACAMGLGTCVIGSAIDALNLSEVKAEIGVPDDFTAVAPVVVGEAAASVPPTPRSEPRVLTWIV